MQFKTKYANGECSEFPEHVGLSIKWRWHGWLHNWTWGI